jgi:tetratricopeptide (TPR) repeat protein
MKPLPTRLSRFGALFCLLAPACSSPRETPAQAGPTQSRQAQPLASHASSAAALAQAEAKLRDGAVQEALDLIDRALADSPADARARTLHGLAMLELAKTDGEPTMVYADALRDFEQASAQGGGRLAWAGASRAARMSLQPSRALEHAQRALQAPREPLADEFPELEPERLAIEAAFDLYVAERRAERDGAAARTELERLLEARLARASTDEWAWIQRANLREWEQDGAGALAALENALDLAPQDEALHTRVVAQSRALGGEERVFEAYDRFVARHPRSALAEWFKAQEHYERAKSALSAQGDAAPRFQRAEQLFAACRALEPQYERKCLDYELACRAGLGWAQLAKGNLPAAEAAFLSMEGLQQGGLEWRDLPAIRSGIDGLAWTADAWQRRGEEPQFRAAAAAIFDRLQPLRPADAAFANNAGFFHREAAVGLEFLARRDMLQAVDETDPAARARLEQAARDKRGEARKHVERSLAAYRECVQRAPTDVRYLNDCALIIVYHAQQHAAEAEQLLLEAVRLGKEQLAELSLAADARDLLQEAWGDAHQNLGLLELTIRKNPARAREWFHKSLEIGPLPRIDRAWIRTSALPACDELEKGGSLDLLFLDPRLWPAS